MIELKNITKSYLLNNGKRHYIFKNLSFKFPDNCSIGLLGKNGAGKSTLVRLLGGLDVPDKGKIITPNSISWPIGLSGGFQGTLSARENIKFVCRLYGLNKEKTIQTLNYVQDFSQIGKYFEEPIKVLSSGMRSRVAFGLSMAFEFDYYLIDEAGAVGDKDFKIKSRKVYEEKLAKSNVIMVSHSMSEIKMWCDKILLLKNGEVTLYDDVEEGIQEYNKGN